VFQAYLIPQGFARIQSILSQFGHPTFASLNSPTA
jgi:hypothetical protein